MPFQSEKQRRYLWANEPEIAREWTNRYGANQGGITRLPFAYGPDNRTVGDEMISIGTPLENQMAFKPGSPLDAQIKKLNTLEQMGYSQPNLQNLKDRDMKQYKEKGIPLSLDAARYVSNPNYYSDATIVDDEDASEIRSASEYPYFEGPRNQYKVDIMDDINQGEPEMDIEEFQNLNNRGIMENININELAPYFNATQQMKNQYFNDPSLSTIDRQIPWHQQGTLKDVFQAEDFPLRDAFGNFKEDFGRRIDKTKQGLGELWQGGKDLGETAWGGIKNIGSMAKKPMIGLASLITKGVDQFDQLPMADQLFISQQMGGKGGQLGQGIYRDPQSGSLKDVGGVNVRSLFGNYADAVHKEFNRYDKNIKSSEEKYGVTYNEDTGLFEGANAAKANQMTKRNRFMYKEYKVKKQKQQKLAADYGRDQQRKENAAQAKREREARERQEATRTYGDNYQSSKDHDRPGGYGHTASSPGATTGSAARSRHARSSELGFSDIRLKDNVELIGKSPSNINIYKFNYLNDPTVYQGVMAQEVPWASIEADNGYLMVDYNKVDVDFKKWHKR